MDRNELIALMAASIYATFRIIKSDRTPQENREAAIEEANLLWDDVRDEKDFD